MPSFTPRQFVILVLLTLAWGLNWPVMKLGVADYPPLAFRAISIWLGLPVLGLALAWMKVPFRVPRAAGPSCCGWAPPTCSSGTPASSSR